jgi:hypothetical protein
MAQALCQRLWPEWQQAYARVEEMPDRVVRASSAVECVNSVVRMHPARHRHVSQSLLDLKRLSCIVASSTMGSDKGRARMRCSDCTCPPMSGGSCSKSPPKY